MQTGGLFIFLAPKLCLGVLVFCEALLRWGYTGSGASTAGFPSGAWETEARIAWLNSDKIKKPALCGAGFFFRLNLYFLGLPLAAFNCLLIASVFLLMSTNWVFMPFKPFWVSV